MRSMMPDLPLLFHLNEAMQCLGLSNEGLFVAQVSMSICQYSIGSMIFSKVKRGRKLAIVIIKQ